MEIADSHTGEKFEAAVELVTRKDYNTIKKDSVRFNAYNWSKYIDKEVYKLRLTRDDKILGLMCIQDYPPEEGVNALEIVLLELIKHYTQAYGFRHIAVKTGNRPDGFMELNTTTSIKLIKKYLD